MLDAFANLHTSLAGIFGRYTAVIAIDGLGTATVEDASLQMERTTPESGIDGMRGETRPTLRLLVASLPSNLQARPMETWLKAKITVNAESYGVADVDQRDGRVRLTLLAQNTTERSVERYRRQA